MRNIFTNFNYSVKNSEILYIVYSKLDMKRE